MGRSKGTDERKLGIGKWERTPGDRAGWFKIENAPAASEHLAEGPERGRLQSLEHFRGGLRAKSLRANKWTKVPRIVVVARGWRYPQIVGMGDHGSILALGSRVLAALGHPCDVCSTAVRTVLATPHDRHAFDHAAKTVGLPDRQALARRLQKHGFPPPGEIQDWLRTIAMLSTWEAEGQALSAQAYAAGIEPTTLHRAVVRATGSAWQQVRDGGPAVLLVRLAERMGPGVRCGTGRGLE